MNSAQGIQVAAKTIEDFRAADPDADAWDVACAVVFNLQSIGWGSPAPAEGESFRHVLENLPFGKRPIGTRA